jgi:hypothetical protein
MVVSDNLRSGITRACFTSPRSIAPTPRWRPTTTPRLCRRGRIGRVTTSTSTGCRATGAMPTGRRSACDGRPARSATTLRRWSRSSCASARTPSKGSAPVSASYGSPRPMAASGSSRLPPRAGDRRALLQLGQLDPEEQPRSPAACDRYCSIAKPPIATPAASRPDCAPTLDQIRALKLDGMAQAFVELQAQKEVGHLAHAEWLAARLRHGQAAIEDVDYRTPRRLDKGRCPQASAALRAQRAAMTDGRRAGYDEAGARRDRGRRAPSPSMGGCPRASRALSRDRFRVPEAG